MGIKKLGNKWLPFAVIPFYADSCMCWKVQSSSRDQFWAGPPLSGRHWWIFTLTVNHSPDQVVSLSLRMLPHAQCWFLLTSGFSFLTAHPGLSSIQPLLLLLLLPAWWFSLFSCLTQKKQETGKERENDSGWAHVSIHALPFQAAGHSQQSCHSLASSLFTQP